MGGCTVVISACAAASKEAPATAAPLPPRAAVPGRHSRRCPPVVLPPPLPLAADPRGGRRVPLPGHGHRVSGGGGAASGQLQEQRRVPLPDAQARRWEPGCWVLGLPDAGVSKPQTTARVPLLPRCSTGLPPSLCRLNVDMLKLIQLGLTFTDAEGNLPRINGELCVWQFNFRCVGAKNRRLRGVLRMARFDASGHQSIAGPVLNRLPAICGCLGLPARCVLPQGVPAIGRHVCAGLD